MRQILSYQTTIADVGAQVVDIALYGAKSVELELTSVTGLAPAGADEVSLQAAQAFAADGMETAAITRLAQEELSRAGQALVDIAGIYAEVDDVAAAGLAQSYLK